MNIQESWMQIASNYGWEIYVRSDGGASVWKPLEHGERAFNVDKDGKTYYANMESISREEFLKQLRS